MIFPAIFTVGLAYRNLIKPVLFQFDPEKVHLLTMTVGEHLGSQRLVKKIATPIFKISEPLLKQQIAGINFSSPIGLAAGFDYEAKLTQILPSLGFGFQTVGTITKSAYEGNSRPMLGRLPKSKSLMVNKGFKNLGAKETIQNLSGLSFEIPVGISIGRTNSLALKTQKQSIADIIETFTFFEESNIGHSYYELNISCPNLFGDITFYPTRNLRELFTEIDRLRLEKPVFVKMPIDKTDSETLSMLEIISKHYPVGVIFGNLQKNRRHPSLYPDEVAKFSVGNFSGKPTFSRSNELIKLAYKNYRQKLIIIGCGGVFNADDAWQKIICGASLVQLITGLIFEGPQLAAEINFGLANKLEALGLKNLSQAVGSQSSSKLATD